MPTHVKIYIYYIYIVCLSQFLKIYLVQYMQGPTPKNISLPMDPMIYLRNNYRMPGSMLILTWVGIIFVIILHRAKARCKILTNTMPILSSPFPTLRVSPISVIQRRRVTNFE